MSERCTYVVYVRTWLGGVCIIPKKKRIPTVLGPTKRLVSLVNSEVYFTELFQKIRYQYFECNDMLTQMKFYHIFDIHDVRNSWAYWKMATNFQFHNIKF